MPISSETYGDKTVRPYLQGLLPDNRETRRAIARRYGVSSENPLALLEHIGLDCPGAVQLCPPENEDAVLRDKRLVPLSDEAIAKRLEGIASHREASWTLASEHWSLGGAQEKIALRFEDGAWFQCEGSAATTHILKPGIPYLQLQALNEYACMALARECGVPAARATYRLFGKEPAIVVERYDRIRSNGSALRIHQEDLCQALRVSPDQKYASDGGPSTSDVIALLKKTSRSERNVLQFALLLFFNYLVGGSDAHAKNFSLLHGVQGDTALAPLYDAASIFPYRESERETIRMARSIGGENRFGHVGKGALGRFARTCEIDADRCFGIMGNLAAAMLEHLDNVFAHVAAIPEGDELASRLEPAIRSHCELTIARLS